MDSNGSRSSISSPVMNSSVISDKDHQILSAKYTKLAAEYSKVRAQLGVLKKAVLEEQSKNVTVSEEMKHKEQMIRKSEAEMDSLNFRNQQLTRRVEILQEDLDRKASDASSGSRKKASISDNNAAHSGGTHNKVVSGHFHRDTERVSASESLNSVMGEELQLKIAENAKLHAALHGVDKRYEDMIGGLQSRIKELEATISKHAQAERADDTRLKELVHGLKIENADLTSEIKRLEHNLDDEKEKVVILQVQLESSLSITSSNGDVKSTENINTIASKDFQKEHSKLSPNPTLRTNPNIIPTSSIQTSHQNQVNPPLTATEARIQTVELLSQIGENIQEIIAAMSDLHTYWEHRIKDTHAEGEVWTDNSKKLQNHLLENVQYLKPIEQAFQDVLSAILAPSCQQNVATSLTLPTWFASFAINLDKYVNYVQGTIQPLIFTSLAEESNKISCSSTQQNVNDQIQSAFRSFNSTLAEVSSLIQVLAEATVIEETESSSGLEKIEILTVKISELSREASNLSSTYQSKASDESELPTVSSSLRTTNQCIVSATVSLTSGIENLSRKLANHLPRIGALMRANFELVSSDFSVEEADHSAKDSESKSNKSEKYDTIENSSKESSSYLSLINELNDNLDNVKKQSDNLNERLKKSEQDKEHWKVEYQLVQMKHDKLKKQMDDTSKEMQENCDDTELDLGIIISEDKRIYENRISELVADRLMADSKATNFYLECIALQKRIKFREKNKLKIEKELQNAQDRISNLHEGIGSTNSNYEEQISMLSEHVANMNEKLAEKTEEIQKLQFDLNQKRHKGGKR